MDLLLAFFVLMEYSFIYCDLFLRSPHCIRSSAEGTVISGYL